MKTAALHTPHGIFVAYWNDRIEVWKDGRRIKNEINPEVAAQIRELGAQQYKKAESKLGIWRHWWLIPLLLAIAKAIAILEAYPRP